MVEGGSHKFPVVPASCQQRRAWSPLLESVLAGRPNPSIERTCPSGLRPLRPAAHVER